MKYKSVVVTKRGGPEVLQIVEKDLRPPSSKEVRVKVLAVPVCLPDVENRYGRSPFKIKVPFVPGYAVVGDVDEVGNGVTRVAVGDRVAALMGYGGYTEYVYLGQNALIPVPVDLDPAEVAPLILNYIVVYQTLHRSAKVKNGAKILIIGASGGIGTAYLQLGRLMNLTMYGVASKSKHDILIQYGAVPIDYHTQDFVEVIRQAEPDGIDAVFDSTSGDYISRGLSLLRPGGVWVAYGNPLSLSRTISLLLKVFFHNLWPGGKLIKVYGTNLSNLNWRPFAEDWAALFKLLEEGKIKPVIMKRFFILDAAKANELLESGQVVGNIVLLSSELSPTYRFRNILSKNPWSK